ncbi:hypothetical protein BG004_001389, partial [Podila humilis]
ISLKTTDGSVKVKELPDSKSKILFEKDDDHNKVGRKVLVDRDDSRDKDGLIVLSSANDHTRLVFINNATKPASSRFSLQKYYYPRNKMSASLSPPLSPASTPTLSSNVPASPATTSFSKMDSNNSGSLPPVAFAGPRTLGLIPQPKTSSRSSIPTPTPEPEPEPADSTPTPTLASSSPALLAPSPALSPISPPSHAVAISTPLLSPPAEPPIAKFTAPVPVATLMSTTESIPDRDDRAPQSETSLDLDPHPMKSSLALVSLPSPKHPELGIFSPLSPLSPLAPPSMVTITPSSPPSSPSTAPSFSLSHLSSASTGRSSTSLSLLSPPISTPPSLAAEEPLITTITSPQKSDLVPYPASGISPARLAALLRKATGAAGLGQKYQLLPLVLDLRPNPDFEPLSIVHSININLPTLLMRRYRRGGVVSSFALESFITMPADKDLYDSIQDGWRTTTDHSLIDSEEHNVVVLDHDMKSGKEDFGRSASPAWTLVNVLERGGGSCGGRIKVWYLEGGFDAFQAWDSDSKFLVYPGSTCDLPQDTEGSLSVRHDGQLATTPHSFPSSPVPMTPITTTATLAISDAQTEEAINNAVSLTTASLSASPGGGRRGAPVRRESLFSLNTKSLQRPAGLNRAQTIGVSAINVKPISIPPLNTGQPQTQQGPPTLRHKGSWLTVPSAINTVSANNLAGPGALSPAMSIGSHPLDVAQSASTDHTSAWSANSGGFSSGSGSCGVHGTDGMTQSGPHSMYQSGLVSKRSFSSTTTLSSATHLGPSHGIQEEEEEEDDGTAVVPNGQSSPNLRRHHSGHSAYSTRSTNIIIGGAAPGSYFDVGVGSDHSSNNHKNISSTSLHRNEAPHPFDNPQHPFSTTQGAYDGAVPAMNHFGDGYSSSFNNHTAMVNNPPHPYDEDMLDEGGDNGEQEISCILPNFLFLGPEIATEEQFQELERLGVKRVLNMARECEDALVQNRPNMTYYKIGVQDHIEADVSAGLLQAVDIIAASPDSPIYVHCKAGKSRSVTATIAYLITQLHWPLNKAYDHVLTQRPCMCPNIGFVTELMRMEEKTLGIERAGGLVRAGSLNSILSLSTSGSGHTYNNAHHHHHHSLNLGSPKVLSAKNSISNMSSMSSLSTMAIVPQMH